MVGADWRALCVVQSNVVNRRLHKITATWRDALHVCLYTYSLFIALTTAFENGAEVAMFALIFWTNSLAAVGEDMQLQVIVDMNPATHSSHTSCLCATEPCISQHPGPTNVIVKPSPHMEVTDLIRSEDRLTISHHYSMDPRHTLYRTLDKLTIDPEMSARTDQEAANVQASSGVTPESIEKKLKEELGAEYVEIADLSGMFFVPL